MLVQNRSHYVTVHLRYNNEMCCTKRSLPMLHYMSVRPCQWCNVMRLLSASAFYIVLTPHGLFMKPNLFLSVFLLSYVSWNGNIECYIVGHFHNFQITKRVIFWSSFKSQFSQWEGVNQIYPNVYLSYISKTLARALLGRK